LEVLAIGTKECLLAELPSVAGRELGRVFRAAADTHQPALGIPGGLGKDLNEAVHRERTPKRPDWTPHHLDPIDVFDQRVLSVPLNAGEEGSEQAPAVQHG
jgi:hypothetical protein